MQNKNINRNYIPLFVERCMEKEGVVIQEGITINNCTSFCLYLNNINKLIENSTMEQDSKFIQNSKDIQKIYEIHRQLIEYIQINTQSWVDFFNEKFKQMYSNDEDDIHLHLLQFNGSDTFIFVMKSQNKQLIKQAIFYWKYYITQLQHALRLYSISPLTTIYQGEISMNIYEQKCESIQLNYFLYGSAINGSIRGCKLSKALDLSLNLLLHQDLAANFIQKTSLLKYIMKKRDTSYVKVNDAVILGSFFVIPYSSIKDTPDMIYNINSFIPVLNEIKDKYDQNIQEKQNNEQDLNANQDQEQIGRQSIKESGQNYLEHQLKNLSENNEGFEGASLIKLQFLIPNHFRKSQTELPNKGNNENKLNNSQINSKIKDQQLQKSPNKQNEASIQIVDWDEERKLVKNKLSEIMNNLEVLINTLDINVVQVFFCAIQNILTVRLMIRNKIDYSARTAILVSSIQQLQLPYLKKLKASAQLFFFYLLSLKTYSIKDNKDQISQQNHYLRDRQVQYLVKQNGDFKYNRDTVNFFMRENPKNLLLFQTHFNPILNHAATYQNVNIYINERKTIIQKMKQCVDFQNNNSFPEYQNELILLEGDIGSGKSSVLKLLCSDIQKEFNPSQCVIFTKSLRGTLYQEIKLRFQLSLNSPQQQGKQNRRLFFNSFRELIYGQSIYHCKQLDISYQQGTNYQQQQIIIQRMHLLLTLQTFLTRDNLNMLPKPQTQNKNNNDNQFDYVEINEQMRKDLAQLAYELLKEYLTNLKVKLIVFIVDDLQYQDKWSWELLQMISKQKQPNYSILLIGTFRFHLPSELNEDIATYTQLEPKYIPMIKKSQQLFENNLYLNDKIKEIPSNQILRVNINSISAQDQQKLLIETLQLFYTSKIDYEKSKETINYIIIQLFRKYQCNTPLKIISFIHILCKSSYILVYEIEDNNGDKNINQKRPSQMGQLPENQNNGLSTQQQDQQLKENEQNSQNNKEVYIGINESLQFIENNIFETQVSVPFYFLSANHALMKNSLQEREDMVCMIPKQKYKQQQQFQENQLLSKLNEELIVSSSQNYLKQCDAVTIPNRSILIYKVLSLMGDKFNINKLKFYLQHAFGLVEEQILDIISDMYLYRFIIPKQTQDEQIKSENLNSSQSNMKQPKRSLNSSQITQNMIQVSQKLDQSMNQLSDLSIVSQRKPENLDFIWNENMFFFIKQSLKSSLSLRMQLLQHKSYFDTMIELLQNLYQKNAIHTEDFAELFMELIHHNCEYSPDKFDTFLKKISPSITFLFRKRIFFHGEVFKLSSRKQGLVKCQIKLNSSTLFIYKEIDQEEQNQQDQMNSQLINNNQSNLNENNNNSQFQAQVHEIKEDLMLSTARFQNIRSIWSMMKNDYSYELIPEKQTIKIHVQHLTKNKEKQNSFVQNKAISITFSNLLSYYTFQMSLKYLQIETYHPNFTYEKKQNHLNSIYSLKFPMIKPLPFILDPLLKTDLISSIPFSQLSTSAQNLYFIYKNQNYLKKYPKINQIKNQILQFISKGLLQNQTSDNKSIDTINLFSNIFNTNSQNIFTNTQPEYFSEQNQQKIFEQEMRNQMISSIGNKVEQIKEQSLHIIQEQDSQYDQTHKDIEPLVASRQGSERYQVELQNNNKQGQSLDRNDQLTHNNLQDKIFEIKVQNENQPETGKFNTLEGLGQIQDNFTQHTHKVLNSNNNEMTETFRKNSDSHLRLQVIQEEEQKYKKENVNKSQQSIYKQSYQDNQNINENELFDQIESERAQYKEQIYQEQLEQSIQLNKNSNHHQAHDLMHPYQHQLSLLNNPNKSMTPPFQAIQQGTNQNQFQDQNLNNKSKQQYLQPINDSTSMIMSESIRQKVYSQQGMANQRQNNLNPYINKQNNQILYQLPIVNENGLLNSYRYDQIQKNQQQPLQMSVTQRDLQFDMMEDVEEEENPLFAMNGMKQIQVQLTPIQSATKSRSISPFSREQSAYSSIQHPFQYNSASKFNTITPVKQNNSQSQYYSSIKSQQPYQTDQNKMNYSDPKFNQIQYSNNGQQNSKPIQHNPVQSFNNNNNSQYNPFEQVQDRKQNQSQNLQQNNINNKYQQPNYNQNGKYQKQTTELQSQEQSIPNSNNNRQPLPSSKISQQTFNQDKFQQDLQKRLEQVLKNQEEYQKEIQQNEVENQRNLSQYNINISNNNNQMDDQLELPVYQQRYSSQEMKVILSDRTDQNLIDDEIQENDYDQLNRQEQQQQNSKNNINIINNQQLKASNNYLQHSNNTSNILNSFVMNAINQQEILPDYTSTKSNKVNGNNSVLKNESKQINQSQQNISQNVPQLDKSNSMNQQQNQVRNNQEVQNSSQQINRLSQNSQNQSIRSSMRENSYKDNNNNVHSQEIIQFEQRSQYSLRQQQPIIQQDNIQNQINTMNQQEQQQKQSLNNTGYSNQKNQNNINNNYNNNNSYQQQNIQQRSHNKSIKDESRKLDNSRISEIQDLSNRTNKIQNVYIDNYSSNRQQFQSNSQIPKQQPQQQQQIEKQDLNKSATKAAQKQHDLFQKKKENLKKYQSNTSSTSINAQQNNDKMQGSQQQTKRNEQYDDNINNLSEQLYQSTDRNQFASNNFSPINQSVVAYEEDSYIGMITRACQTVSGDNFNLQPDDCVVLKFIDDNYCEIHHEGKVGNIPKQNIKVIQRAKQFLINLNSYNKKKQKEFYDSALNNVHKILTDFDQ